MVKITFSPLQNINKHHFQVRLDNRQTLKKFEILTKSHRLTPLEKIQDGGCPILTSRNMVTMTFLPLQNITKHHFQVQFNNRQTLKNFEILTKRHRLTPLEKIQGCPILTSRNMVKVTFSPLQNITKHHFQVQFNNRQTLKKFEILTKSHRLTPLEKIQDGGCPILTSRNMVKMIFSPLQNITKF